MFTSPFDEAALSRPMLDGDTQKKKFSWTSTVTTVFTIDDDDSSYAESYEAPTDAMFDPTLTLQDDDLNDHNEQAPLVTVDLEQAVLHERHKGIQEINSNMKLVKDIQQDLRNVVDSQGSDLQKMSWLAIEAFEETESGLEQLQRSSYSTMEAWIQRQRSQRSKGLVGILVSLLLLAAYAIHKVNAADPQDFNGDPQKFP